LLTSYCLLNVLAGDVPLIHEVAQDRDLECLVRWRALGVELGCGFDVGGIDPGRIMAGAADRLFHSSVVLRS
jgi:hypothetical protein